MEKSKQSTSQLPSAVVRLGWVSLLSDVSSEAIFPLLPAFLKTLGASNAFIGLLEGAADALSNLVKYISGVWADSRLRFKPMVLWGYSVSTLARPLVALALSPWHVLAVRLVDRLGKGLRTSPRDALIAYAAPAHMHARAYGFHRAMDHSGAALGTALSLGLLFLLGGNMPSASGEQLRQVFMFAAMPGFLAVAVLWRVREPELPKPDAARATQSEPLPPALRRVLWPMALFAFANASDAFVLVKASTLGASVFWAPVIWFGLNLTKAATATFGGRLADQFGRRQALALGWAVYGVTWGSLGWASSLTALAMLVMVYGVSHGLVEGAERALVADLASGRGKGKAFGAYNMVMGLCALVASTAFGWVWDHFGQATAFVGSASLALVAALVLWGSRDRNSPGPSRLHP